MHNPVRMRCNVKGTRDEQKSFHNSSQETILNRVFRLLRIRPYQYTLSLGRTEAPRCWKFNFRQHSHLPKENWHKKRDIQRMSHKGGD